MNLAKAAIILLCNGVAECARVDDETPNKLRDDVAADMVADISQALGVGRTHRDSQSEEDRVSMRILAMLAASKHQRKDEGAEEPIRRDTACGKGSRKTLASGKAGQQRVTDVFACRELMAKDDDCGNQFYSDGHTCVCVLRGKVCDYIASPGDYLFTVQEAATNTAAALASNAPDHSSRHEDVAAAKPDLQMDKAEEESAAARQQARKAEAAAKAALDKAHVAVAAADQAEASVKNAKSASQCGEKKNVVVTKETKNEKDGNLVEGDGGQQVKEEVQEEKEKVKEKAKKGAKKQEGKEHAKKESVEKEGSHLTEHKKNQQEKRMKEKKVGHHLLQVTKHEETTQRKKSEKIGGEDVKEKTHKSEMHQKWDDIDNEEKAEVAKQTNIEKLKQHRAQRAKEQASEQWKAEVQKEIADADM